MASRIPRRWRLIAAGAGATLAMLGIGALLFAVSGIYNVAASRDHFWITRQIIQIALNRSVSLHSRGVPAPPDLEDPDLIRLGAAHYHGECALCHGAPGEKRNPIVQRMLPQPPFLGNGIDHWSRDELLWIVRHGLKMTGMPAFVALERADEVWAVVAFLQKLPMPRNDYLRLALGNADAKQSRENSGQDVAETGSETPALTRCVRCHENEDAAPVSRHVPRLAGQPEAYLLRALRSYAQGTRRSGMMQPVAAALDERELAAVAQYYAQLPWVADKRESPRQSQEAVERGGQIARTGIRDKGVPPCLACHGRDGAAAFPRLAGQSAPYIRTQLKLWQQGLRDETAYGEIMAVIARRLDAEQIDAVAAHFASLTPAAANVPPASRDSGGTP